MFDLIASGIQAFNQVGMFAAATICLAIGGLILGDSLYWRLYALRVTGTVIGVVPNGNTYTPVYRYTGPDGRSHEARSNSGSSSVKGKETGRVVHLMVAPHNPGLACESGAYLFYAIGTAFLVPGIWLGYTALTAYPITWMTWLMAAVFIVHAGERVYRIWKSAGAKLSLAQWRQHSAAIDLSTVRPVESLPTTPAPAQMSQGNRKFAIPVLGIFAVILTGAGLYNLSFVYALQKSGTRAQGEIVRFVEKSDSHDSVNYYAVVRFRTADNRMIQFEDQVGSNHPIRRQGDQVPVLYLANSPNRSMIDRGMIINWGIPALLLSAAAGITVLMLKLLRGPTGLRASGGT